uniref:Peptidase S1 domain-containing protein n=1 Tax=Steinernema glaseri TaxID=37863 RepID=A0A1I8ADG0_9BILA
MATLKLIVLLYFFLLSDGSPFPRSELIYGGHRTAGPKFPFHAVFWKDDFGFFCGGSIIDEAHILTAGHCASFVLSNGTTTVYGGVWDLERRQDAYVQKSGIKNIIIHPLYNETSLEHDIAIIELENPFKITYTVQTVEVLANDGFLRKPIPHGAVLEIGFGALSESFNESAKPETPPSRYLKYAPVKMVKLAACRKSYAEANSKPVIFPVTSDNLCTTSDPGARNGDSGSPVLFYDKNVLKFRQFGLISNGIADQQGNLPGSPA